MSTIELVAFGTLWLVLVTLGLLLLLLYRQVERAYQRAAFVQASGLLAGTVAPEIEVLTARGTEVFGFPDDDRLILLAFLGSECSACERLVGVLHEGVPEVDHIVLAITGEEQSGSKTSSSNGAFETIWPAYPGSLAHDYGVHVVPLLYLVRSREVLASAIASSRAEVQRLIDSALQQQTREEALSVPR